LSRCCCAGRLVCAEGQPDNAASHRS
jgi:hypothetical protein